MTTVIADSRRLVIAADSKFHEEGIEFPTSKLFQIGSSIFGECGETRGIGKFFRWLRGGLQDKDRPKFSGDLDDFCAIELRTDGVYYWDQHLFPTRATQRFLAIGSGGDLAMLACEKFGCSVERAVELAARYDTQSGLPVQVMRLTRRRS